MLYHHRKRKKCNYNQRIIQVEQRTFSHFVFSLYVGMGRECQAFYSRLSELLAEKRNIHKSIMMHWIRSKLCYELTEIEQDIAA